MGPRSTRCFWFEDDGTPIRPGCPNGHQCHFVHPDDGHWDRLERQYKRPPGYRGKKVDAYDDSSASTWKSRYRSTSRSRSPSGYSRKRESSRRKDSSPSSSSRRRSTEKEAEREEPRRPSIASTSSTSIPTAPASFNRIPERPPPSGPSALRPKKPDTEQIPGLRILQPPSMTSTNPPPPPVSSPPSMPPPPPPPATSIPPPYPLPEVPKILTVKIPPRVEEPTPEEKRKIWEQRIKLFADSYQAKRDLERFEQMHKYATDISQSNFFPTFSEDDKARFNDDLAELLVNRDTAKKAHEDALEKLIEQGSWPLGPPPTTKVDENEEQERRDILQHVQELNDTARKMSQILGDLAMQTKPPVLPLPSGDDDDIYEDDAMAVDDNAAAAAGSSSRKRGDGPGTQPDPNLPTREELELYHGRLEKLEGQITDLDNELVQYDDEIKRSFEYQVENRIEEYNAARRQRDKERREKEKKIRDEEMSKVNADAQELENDVKEVGEEVAEVITKIESLKIQLEEETKQRDIMETKVSEVNDRLQAYIQERDANVRTMQTLEASLKAYQSAASKPSPPPTPLNEAAPTSAYILSQLHEPILQVIRSHLQPMLAQSRLDTEALVRERNMEIVKKIWPRMELVSTLLANVADKLDRENTNTNTNTPTPTTATTAAPVQHTHLMHSASVPQIIQHQPIPARRASFQLHPLPGNPWIGPS